MDNTQQDQKLERERTYNMSPSLHFSSRVVQDTYARPTRSESIQGCMTNSTRIEKSYKSTKKLHKMHGKSIARRRMFLIGY